MPGEGQRRTLLPWGLGPDPLSPTLALSPYPAPSLSHPPAILETNQPYLMGRDVWLPSKKQEGGEWLKAQQGRELA